MRKLFKAVIIFIIIHTSGTVSLAQSKLNQVDRMGRKTGLWICIENKRITRIEDYSSGVPDGFFIKFTDSGEIVSYQYFDYGVTLNADSIFTDTIAPGGKMNHVLKSFTGVSVYQPSYSIQHGWAVYRNGYLHGISRLPSFGKKENFRDYINLRGCSIYTIFYDLNGTPSGYQNLVRYKRTVYTEHWYLKKNKLSITFFNPLEQKVMVPSLRSRTLSYVHNTIKEKLYEIVGDTLIVILKADPPKKYRFTDGIGEHNKRRGRYQNVSASKFTEIVLLPHSKVRTQAKVIIPRGVSINHLLIVTDDEEILLDKNSFGKLPTFYDR